jgi:hypothetical protein
MWTRRLIRQTIAMRIDPVVFGAGSEIVGRKIGGLAPPNYPRTG